MKHHISTAVPPLVALVALGALGAAPAAGQQQDPPAAPPDVRELTRRLETLRDLQVDKLLREQRIRAPRVQIGRPNVRQQAVIQLRDWARVQNRLQGRVVVPKGLLVNGQNVQVWGAGLTTRGGDTSPFCQGVYRDALEAFDEARAEIDRAQDEREARAALDRIETALVRARDALWDQKTDGERDAEPVQADRQPAPAAPAAQVVAQQWQVVFGAQEEQPEPSPFLRGDYLAAIGTLDAARVGLGTATAFDKAFGQLDAATCAVMKAARAMRRQLQPTRRGPGGGARRR